VAGSAGDNRQLLTRLSADVARRGGEAFFPDLAFCTDNGAMIAHAGALRIAFGIPRDYRFDVRPRWPLDALNAPA
jgi:N6-L-threonylcarbamoyladenine synthase